MRHQGAAGGTTPWPPGHTSSDSSSLFTLCEHSNTRFDRHPLEQTTTARCGTLPLREDRHTVGMKPYDYLLLATHCVQDTTERATPTPTPHVDAPLLADAKEPQNETADP